MIIYLLKKKNTIAKCRNKFNAIVQEPYMENNKILLRETKDQNKWSKIS